MAIIQMNGYLATDLAGVFSYDMQATATIGATNYVCLCEDEICLEIDADGGPERINIIKAHFMVTTLSSVNNGSFMTLTLPGQTSGTKRMVTQSETSADGNELIVSLRAA